MSENINFINTDSAELYSEVVGSLMEYCNEALYPGDERRIFAEGLVQAFLAMYTLFNDRAKQRTLQHARGTVLDALGKRQDVERLQPAPASARFRFTASAVIGQNIVIPEGTRITTDGSVYFATKTTAVLPAGATDIDVEGVCMTSGADYNGFTAGAISTLVDLIPYIAGAVNVTASSGGDDGEPYTDEGDERYRERIRLAPSSQSTAGPESGYRFWALTADADIVDVAIDCPEDSPNEVNIYPLMRGGLLPDSETLAKVLEAVNAEKRRPMTDFVQAIEPEQVEYEIELKYYCSLADEPTLIRAIEGDGGAIDRYIEWQGAALARDINPDKLREFLFKAKEESGASGELRMDVISPSFTELSKMQSAKLYGLPVVTHEVIE